MKIGETRPSGTVSGSRRERDAASRYARTAGLSAPAPSDTAAIMGIPEAELTPKVRAAIMTLMQEVDTLRKDLERTHTRLAQLERLADQDTLTPIPNRRAFVRELGRIVSYSQRYEEPSSLIYFDVNEFKHINDTYGHAAGDAALMHIAESLLFHLRESDIVGRLGGDEFGVILVRADAEQARSKAQSLADEIAAKAVVHDGKSFNISVSFGLTTFRTGESATEAMAAADKAMYEHKAARRAQK